jgi:hypothetical protein
LQKEASEHGGSSNCPEYLRHADKRLTEEMERCRSYLDASTEPKITRVVETELIFNQVGRRSRSGWWSLRQCAAGCQPQCYGSPA